MFCLGVRARSVRVVGMRLRCDFFGPYQTPERFSFFSLVDISHCLRCEELPAEFSSGRIAITAGRALFYFVTWIRKKYPDWVRRKHAVRHDCLNLSHTRTHTHALGFNFLIIRHWLFFLKDESLIVFQRGWELDLFSLVLLFRDGVLLIGSQDLMKQKRVSVFLLTCVKRSCVARANRKRWQFRAVQTGGERHR